MKTNLAVQNKNLATSQGTIAVNVWHDSYAPCMWQAQAVSDKITQAIMDTIRANGYDGDETTALIDYDAMEDELTPSQWKRLLKNGYGKFMIDAWIFAHWYGYDAYTLFE